MNPFIPQFYLSGRAICYVHKHRLGGLILLVAAVALAGALDAVWVP